MKKNLRFSPLLLAVLIILQSVTFAVDLKTTPLEAETRAGAITEYGAASVQYALICDGEIVVSGSAGVSGGGTDEPPSADTMYGIGSLSKMYTTVVVLKLCEEGEIELDKPVTAYIPEFEMADARYRDITVRMLLNHSSGLMGSTYVDGFLWDDKDTAAHDSLLAELKTQRLKANPGEFSVYCNDGFTLAEILAERVSGKSFTQLIHEYITVPLGLENTLSPQDDFDFDRLARTYSDTELSQENPNEVVGIIGTGGIYSTAEDSVSFARIFMKDGEILGETLKNATMVKEYLNGRWLRDEANLIAYGLGWDSVNLYPFEGYGIKALSKGGDIINFHSSLIVLPEYNMAAAVMSSGGSSTYNQILATNILLNALYEKGVIDGIKPDVPAAKAEQRPLDSGMKKYEGLYASSLGIYSVKLGDEGVLEYANAYTPNASQKLIYCGNGIFRDESGTAELYFVTQDDRTYLCQDVYQTIPYVGQIYFSQYIAQKMEERKIPDDALEAWKSRSGTIYLSVSEKYTSVIYSTGVPMMGVVISDSVGGYLSGNRIVSANLAEAAVEIPMQYGRDTMDLSFMRENGVEYCVAGGRRFISLAGVETLYGGKSSVSTIQPNGDTRWYMIGAELAGKTMTVSCPADSGFIVYSAGGELINQSSVSHEYTVTLEAGGIIAFAGNTGAVFNITVE
ncbi:MAG: beta-lactamase family protein [Oscillospiraceae bacterium]|jgi:CubicO group peptidase (beta-lactamase class C family)|nr:beta-lactamase family protein [Oscillospiraceae bacterium]